MNQSIDCEIAQDLMALCAAKKAGKATMRLLSEHVRECESCRLQYEALLHGSPIPMRLWRRRHAAERDLPLRYFRWSLLALNLLAALLCMVVNFAVDERLSWSWIVAGAMASSTLPMLVYMQARTYRFIKAMLCFSVLSLPLLGVIQIVLSGMGHSDVWIWQVAVPVAALWLTVFWAGILLAKWRNFNGFYCFTIILLLCFPADIATSAIAARFAQTGFSIHWITGACCVAAALVCGAMGALFEIRSAKKR